MELAQQGWPGQEDPAPGAKNNQMNQSYEYKISIIDLLEPGETPGETLFGLYLFIYLFVLISMTGIKQTDRMAAKYFSLFTASLAAASTTMSMVQSFLTLMPQPLLPPLWEM